MRYLPAPGEVRNGAQALDAPGESIVLSSDPDDPLTALAFKLEDGPYGQLTYLRIYQGTIAKGETVVNTRTNRKVRVGRNVRMHADELEEIARARAGDIGALFGVDCASGDTFTAEGHLYTVTALHLPDPASSPPVTP